MLLHKYPIMVEQKVYTYKKLIVKYIKQWKTKNYHFAKRFGHSKQLMKTLIVFPLHQKASSGIVASQVSNHGWTRVIHVQKNNYKVH